ncbi:NAD(P)H-dependent oxidoreductase subunit E [Opitutus sp. ER46]|uniref:NADH-quinone oxidoreductase subunit NuoE family protein n=1 Tax=Opitutus sp. ER46 TaxID=2161864 RepID=UPI0018EE5C5B|nr:NAD(P)H-dependent oxidoreductase subunit E [Opitutus sp. ER46]
MNPTASHPRFAESSAEPDLVKRDEAALIDLLDQLVQKHGFIPREVSDEISRMVEVKLERLRRIQSKLDTTIRRDVQNHVARWRDEEGNLIMILHAIQNQHGYVPREVAMELARELGVKLARIYEVITFYHYFKLQPPGAHNITVCNGTACYLKGSTDLLNELRTQLGVAEGQTTADRQIHLDVVRCIGCCGMAPAMVVDGKTCGHAKPADIAGHIATVRAKKTEVKK